MKDTFDLTKEALVAEHLGRMDNHLSGSAYTLRQKVALTCRVLFENGHDSGLAGQLSAKGDQAGSYYTQRLGLGFDEITASNLLLVDEHLNVVEGKGMPNPANRFHSWVYRARPDVSCIVHTHALHTAALGMLEVPLEISHMDNCVLYDEVAFVKDWPGIPVGNEEGEFIAAALGTKRALMLPHHGLLVAATSVEEACVLSMAFERAARMQLLAMAAGTVKPIDVALGKEARNWILRPKRNEAAFAYYVRRLLAGGRHADCAK